MYNLLKVFIFQLFKVDGWIPVKLVDSANHLKGHLFQKVFGNTFFLGVTITIVHFLCIPKKIQSSTEKQCYKPAIALSGLHKIE